MQYQVITESKPEKLSETITNLLNLDWKCQGGISICHNDGGFIGLKLIYAQAMIKED